MKAEFSDERATVLDYGAAMLAASLSLTALWWHASRDRRFLHEGTPQATVRAVLAMWLVVPLVFLLSAAVSFVSVPPQPSPGGPSLSSNASPAASRV